MGCQIKLPNSRRRYDFGYANENESVLVEYDGDEHYRSTWVIRGDREKTELAAKHGYRLVRFPYWVQLDSNTLQHFFGIEAEVHQDFPHGFITTKLFPASFCELGIVRFEAELVDLPDGVARSVVESLKARCTEHGVEYVLPTKLRDLMN